MFFWFNSHRSRRVPLYVTYYYQETIAGTSTFKAGSGSLVYTAGPIRDADDLEKLQKAVEGTFQNPTSVVILNWRKFD